MPSQKSKLRGTRSKLTRLRNRTWKAIEHLDYYVWPKLKTNAKKNYKEALDPVKRLLGYEDDE